MSAIGLYGQNEPEEHQPPRLKLGQFLIAFAVVIFVFGLTIYTVEPVGSQRPESNPDAVQGLGSNWLLAQQASRNQEVMAELQHLRDRNDFAGFAGVLKSRAAELDKVIAEVEADGSYSVTDKRKILAVLTQERDWAVSSYIGLQTLD